MIEYTVYAIATRFTEAINTQSILPMVMVTDTGVGERFLCGFLAAVPTEKQKKHLGLLTSATDRTWIQK